MCAFILFYSVCSHSHIANPLKKKPPCHFQHRNIFALSFYSKKWTELNRCCGYKYLFLLTLTLTSLLLDKSELRNRILLFNLNFSFLYFIPTTTVHSWHAFSMNICTRRSSFSQARSEVSSAVQRNNRMMGQDSEWRYSGYFTQSLFYVFLPILWNLSRKPNSKLLCIWLWL